MTWTNGFRQFQLDFMVPGYGLRGTSLTRRPDAVSMDYLWSAAPGPVANGDPSAGLAARAWYARADEEGSVWLARANAGNTAWEAETLLFSYTGPPILEMDLAFEQQGRPVIAAERATGSGGAPEVWLYWYDPTELPDPGFVFESFGPGRTPRTLFDNLPFTADGDVQFIYLKDGVGLVRREQRDRYQVEYGSPLTDTTNRYIEEVLTTQGNRLRVEGSLHDPVTGTYSRWVLESLPYPVRVGPDGVGVSCAFLPEGAELKVVLINGFTEPDATTKAVLCLGGTLGPVLLEAYPEPDEVTKQVALVSGTLVVSLLQGYPEPDGATKAVTLVSGTLVTTVIVHSTNLPDEITKGVTFLSGTLEVV